MQAKFNKSHNTFCLSHKGCLTKLILKLGAKKSHRKQADKKRNGFLQHVFLKYSNIKLRIRLDEYHKRQVNHQQST